MKAADEPRRRARRTRATSAGAPPADGAGGFIYTWYPALWMILAFEVGAEIGGAFARFAPALGRPLFGVLYAPWAPIRWIAAAPKIEPVPLAIACAIITIVIAFFILLSIQQWDMSKYGRNWGWWGYVLAFDDILGKITLLVRGIPPD